MDHSVAAGAAGGWKQFLIVLRRVNIGNKAEHIQFRSCSLAVTFFFLFGRHLWRGHHQCYAPHWCAHTSWTWWESAPSGPSPVSWWSGSYPSCHQKSRRSRESKISWEIKSYWWTQLFLRRMLVSDNFHMTARLHYVKVSISSTK